MDTCHSKHGRNLGMPYNLKEMCPCSVNQSFEIISFCLSSLLYSQMDLVAGRLRTMASSYKSPKVIKSNMWTMHSLSLLASFLKKLLGFRKTSLQTQPIQWCCNSLWKNHILYGCDGKVFTNLWPTSIFDDDSMTIWQCHCTLCKLHTVKIWFAKKKKKRSCSAQSPNPLKTPLFLFLFLMVWHCPWVAVCGIPL